MLIPFIDSFPSTQLLLASIVRIFDNFLDIFICLSPVKILLIAMRISLHIPFGLIQEIIKWLAIILMKRNWEKSTLLLLQPCLLEYYWKTTFQASTEINPHGYAIMPLPRMNSDVLCNNDGGNLLTNNGVSITIASENLKSGDQLKKKIKNQ